MRLAGATKNIPRTWYSFFAPSFSVASFDGDACWRRVRISQLEVAHPWFSLRVSSL